MTSEQMIMYAITQAAVAAGVYAAIRADLREALTRISRLENEMDFIRGKV